MSSLPTTARPKPFGLAGAGDSASTLIDRMPPHDLAADYKYSSAGTAFIVRIGV